MTFEQAMHKACEILGYSGHLKEIKYKKDCCTYAEKIASVYIEKPFLCKNSYMYLDSMDFCFYQNGENVEFAISGHVGIRERIKLQNAIKNALELCEVCEWQMKYGDLEQLKEQK